MGNSPANLSALERDNARNDGLPLKGDNGSLLSPSKKARNSVL